MKRLRFGGEDRFIVVVLADQQGRGEPFMHTSDLGKPLSKDQAVAKLRELEVAEADIQRLMAQAEDNG